MLVFVLRVGECLIKVVLTTFTKDLVKGVSATIAVWVTSLLLWTCARSFSNYAYSYFTAGDMVNSIGALVPTILVASAIAAAVALTIWLIRFSDRDWVARVRDETVFVFTHLNMIVFVSAVILLALARIEWLQLLPRIPGPYTILLLLVMFMAVPLWLGRRRSAGKAIPRAVDGKRVAA
jgi:hypothetical protein